MEMPLILYDGHCVLCNFFLRLVIRFDKNQHFRYASLQSAYATKWLETYPSQPLPDSIVLIKEGKCYFYHEAVFLILTQLPYPIKAFLVFRYLPTALNKKIYQLIAKNRYALFGKMDTCPLPDPKNSHQFLD